MSSINSNIGAPFGEAAKRGLSARFSETPRLQAIRIHMLGLLRQHG